MKNINGKIERYSLWAKRKPRYYALIGDLCTEDGDFRSACSYYRKAIEKGVLAYAALGDALFFSNQHKKALDAYEVGAKDGELECLFRLGSCYLSGNGVKNDPKKAIGMYGKAVEYGEPTSVEKIKNAYLKMSEMGK